MKKFSLGLFGLLVLIIALVGFVYYNTSNVPLSAKMDLSDSVIWFDDYFTIEYIDETTIAIGEPRYFQKNYNYLIIGEEKAILLDTGPGVRNIKPVVESLTRLPVTVISSHLHYDHVGNHDQFDRIAMLNIEKTSRRFQSEWFNPSYSEHLGFIEGIEKPRFKVSESLFPNQIIDLGKRVVTVLHTPGHTQESLMLLDKSRHYLFAGDFIYEGDLYAFLPGSDIAEYYNSTQNLLALTTIHTTVLAAHSGSLPASLPVLGHQDLVDLNKALSLVLSEELEGEGTILTTYRVNKRMSLIAN
ncbi:MAG: hydroxyacylglutathione hydrolase [Oceanicoccus sp.]|jgi:hydroxyacylglutathione hydrolase